MYRLGTKVVTSSKIWLSMLYRWSSQYSGKVFLKKKIVLCEEKQIKAILFLLDMIFWENKNKAAGLL